MFFCVTMETVDSGQWTVDCRKEEVKSENTEPAAG